MAGASEDHRRGGERLDGADVGGSVQQLVGYLDKATDKDVKALGSSYKKGDAIGRGGLQQTFQQRLAGTPATEIQLVGTDKKTAKTIGKIEGRTARRSRAAWTCGFREQPPTRSAI